MAEPLWYHYIVSPWVIIKHTLLRVLKVARAGQQPPCGLLTPRPNPRLIPMALLNVQVGPSDGGISMLQRCPDTRTSLHTYLFIYPILPDYDGKCAVPAIGRRPDCRSAGEI